MADEIDDMTDFLLSDDIKKSNQAIQELHHEFNSDTALHAWGDAEKALQSTLDIEKSLNEKAFSFLKFLSPAMTIFLGYILVNFSTFLSFLMNFQIGKR